MPADPRSVNEWLGKASGLPAVLARAEQLARIQRALHESFGESWVQHLRVADLRGTAPNAVLVLHTDHAAVLTRARQQQHLLTSALRKSLGLELAALEVKVKPPLQLGSR